LDVEQSMITDPCFRPAARPSGPRTTHRRPFADFPGRLNLGRTATAHIVGRNPIFPAKKGHRITPLDNVLGDAVTHHAESNEADRFLATLLCITCPLASH
jgi:hypothetical protein